MKIRTWIKWYESYLPPRCRKLRYRECEEYVNINLAETTMDNMRLAFEDNSYSGKGKIYFFRNKLWTKSRITDICAVSDEDKYESPLAAFVYWREHSSAFFPRLWRDGEYPDKKHMVSIARKETSEYLLVDGELYRTTSEPRYEIVTFGLGHNHGGTGMFCSYGYNPNIRNDNYFSAIQGEQAVAYANKVAAGRGDTKDVGKFKPFIVCHMPEIVKVKPSKQHGKGCEFMNMMDSVIDNSESAGEAGLLCIALALAHM